MSEEGIKGLGWKFWGGVAAALGAAAGAWFLGYLPTIWTTVSSAAAWTWSWIWYTVPLPLIALVVLALLALRGVAAMLPAQKVVVAEVQGEEPLSELEQRVLALLPRADGSMVLRWCG